MAKLFRDIIQPYIADYVTTSKVLTRNSVAEVVTGGYTLTMPLNPVRGDHIYIIDADGTFPTNPVILDGNGKNIEGSATFTLDKTDEHIQFYYTGTQWIFLNRFFFENINPFGGGTNRMIPKAVASNYTLTASDYKLWLEASGNITITVGVQSAFFEAIIQNVGTGTITIAGVTNAVGTKITKQWEAAHVYFDGTSWTAVGALTP